MGRTTFALAFGAAVAATSGCGNDHAAPADAGVNTFQADPPSVYVAKVKNILVGLAPTDAEVAAVVASPDALAGLINGWMTAPEFAPLFQAKMQVFFELAFQQTQITEVDLAGQIPPNGLEVGSDLPQLIQNMSESFARTVMAMVNSNQPLTNAFTTKQLMMTPALMQLYAFLDAWNVDDAGTTTDTFRRANLGAKITMESSLGPIALADSLDSAGNNYLHFYSPNIGHLPYPETTCQGQDPITFAVSGLVLEQMMFGMVPGHLGKDGVTQCIARGGGPGGVQFQDTDFTTWSMVTIRPPNVGEATTFFPDIASMRTATELVIKTPHPGFFSTPAFFANWPTNSSNQMRVVLNQALIVATGMAIDGTDSTMPTTTPGLDATHAGTGACFTCHQLLDPTRAVLAGTYSWFDFPQTDPNPFAPGPALSSYLFAFQGVIQPIQTIDDFAMQLAKHPLVAQAWAQKLCYYANSAPCDPADPAFQKIVSDFQTNFSWTTLVSELMASPIITNASETKTWDTNGEVVAVARRDHLCAALNNRLGFVDICGLDSTLTTGKTPSTVALIVSGLPSDGYGRGAPVPVLPVQPTLFYRAGLENICEAVAALVIDGPQTSQPNAKQWSSAQPDAAIADFVGIMMGLPPSDARSAPSISALQAHFASAMATGASANQSLSSTFVVACLSPSFLGIGM